MKILKIKWFATTLAFSLFIMFGSLSSAMANEKKDEKKTEVQKKSEKKVATRWFHFNGNASNPAELDDPSKYVPVETSPCSSTTQTYRCAILIDEDPSNPNQPDLTQPIQAETKRSTPTSGM